MQYNTTRPDSVGTHTAASFQLQTLPQQVQIMPSQPSSSSPTAESSSAATSPTMATTLSECSPTPVDELGRYQNPDHDETQRSLSAEDLLYLLYNRFLDILLIDLQQPHRPLSDATASQQQQQLQQQQNHQATPLSPLARGASLPRHSQDAPRLRIIGAYTLKKLAVELVAATNLGSAIYSIVCNTALRQLISVLGCPFMVVYDEDGAAGGNATRFVSMMDEVVKVTGKQRFNGLRWIRFLRGGVQRFHKLWGEEFCEPYDGLRSVSKSVVDAKAAGNTKAEVTNKSSSQQAPESDEGNDVQSTANRATDFQLQLQLNKVQDDPPCAVLSDFLYLGGIQSTKECQVVDYRFHHVISIGEIPRFVSDAGERVVKSDVDLVLPTPVRRQKFADSSVCRVRVPRSAGSQSLVESRGASVGMAAIDHLTISTGDGEDVGKSGAVAADDHFPVLHYTFALEDASHAPIDAIFQQTNHIIHQAHQNGERVLVHCYGGVSRSATVVIAYLISMRRMSLAEAFATTFRVRPWIRPNDGFWARLQTLELDERVVNVVRLRYRGDQDRRSLASPKKGTSGADAPSATGGTMISSAGAEVTPLSPGAFTFPPQLSPELPPSTIEEVAHSSPPSTTTTPAAIAKKRFGHRRSRTLVKFEDDAATEGSLTTRVMKNMRGEVVERFLRFRHICNTKVFYS